MLRRMFCPRGNYTNEGCFISSYHQLETDGITSTATTPRCSPPKTMAPPSGIQDSWRHPTRRDSIFTHEGMQALGFLFVMRPSQTGAGPGVRQGKDRGSPLLAAAERGHPSEIQDYSPGSEKPRNRASPFASFQDEVCATPKVLMTLPGILRTPAAERKQRAGPLPGCHPSGPAATAHIREEGLRSLKHSRSR